MLEIVDGNGYSAMYKIFLWLYYLEQTEQQQGNRDQGSWKARYLIDERVHYSIRNLLVLLMPWIDNTLFQSVVRDSNPELTCDGLLYGMTRYFRETVLVIPDLIMIDLCPMKAVPVKLEELSNK